MTEIEHLLIRFLFSLIPVVVLYFSMKDRATKQENKAILVLAEQVKSLGEDVRELKTLIQSKQ